MAYRLQKAVLASIKERPHVRKGVKYIIYEAYLGRDPLTKKQRRISNLSKTKLKEEIEAFYASLDSGGAVAVTFSPYEAADARKALDLLAQKKSTLSLTDCVRRVLEAPAAESGCTMTVSAAITAFLASKASKSKDYLKTLRSHLNLWKTEFGSDRLLSEITAKEVKEKLYARIVKENDYGTWKTYNNHLGDILTFVSWCAKPEQKYILLNPLEGMSKLSIPYQAPDYVQHGDISKLFAVLWTHRDESPADLADAILSFFCGMRQVEISRVREGPEAVVINLEDGYIIVRKCKGYTRGIRPRSFKVSDQALAWMRSFDFADAVKISNNQFRRHLVERAKEAHISLPENAGRHTFITMHAAAYHDQKLLTSIVGNTDGVRANSYDGVEIEKNGLDYFKITPETIVQAKLK